MNLRNVIAMVALLVCAGGCLPSINPFYTEKDVTFEPRLLGVWQTKDSTNNVETWKFEKAGTNAYQLVVTDKDHKQGKLDAYLFKIQDQLFLDVIPADCEFAPGQADIIAAAMVSGHLLMRVPQLAPTLQLAYCDYDWLIKYLEAHPGALAGRKEGNRAVLTASTKELQAFIAAHREQLFQKPEEFSRQGTN